MTHISEPIYIPGTQHGNLHQLSVTMSRVTCFILPAHTGSGVSHSRHRKKIGTVLGKKAGKWTGRVEIREEEMPGSRRSMPGYIYRSAPGVKGRTTELYVLNRWVFNLLRPQYPTAGR